MRIVFMATGEIAEPAFEWALRSEHVVAGLVTQPDKPVGRQQILTAPRVKELALAAGVPVIQPERVREEAALTQIREWEPELIVVMAYGQILPQALIQIPPRAIINLHASLLPKYRGAACIQGPLRAGDTFTGWSVIHVVKKLDAGNVIHKHQILIKDGETGGKLHDRLAACAPEVLAAALQIFAENEEVPGVPQDEAQVSYMPKLMRGDGRIDWRAINAEELERLVRAYDPWPGTYGMIEGKRMKIFPPLESCPDAGEPGTCLKLDEEGLLVACASGSVLIQNVQLDGSRRMTITELARGKGQLLRRGFDS